MPEPTKTIDLSDQDNCPIRNVIDRIGDRWSILVLTALTCSPSLRFSEIKRQIGDISQRMLSQTLRRLEQDGYVRRTVFPTVPPRVEYALTDLGVSLMQPLGGLMAWANANFAAVLAAREAYTPPPPQVAL